MLSKSAHKIASAYRFWFCDSKPLLELLHQEVDHLMIAVTIGGRVVALGLLLLLLQRRRRRRLIVAQFLTNKPERVVQRGDCSPESQQEDGGGEGNDERGNEGKVGRGGHGREERCCAAYDGRQAHESVADRSEFTDCGTVPLQRRIARRNIVQGIHFTIDVCTGIDLV